MISEAVMGNEKHRSNIDKEFLVEMFRSEEAIGITYERIFPPHEDEYALLPEGFGQMGRCTNCALFVASRIETAVVAGFRVESPDQNPSCTHEVIRTVMGHDFAVVDGRYIVDLWISLYNGSEDKTVFDCLDPEDRNKIVEIYGNPAFWELWTPDGYRQDVEILLQGCLENLAPEIARKSGLVEDSREEECSFSPGV